jgi:hypothetical protein
LAFLDPEQNYMVMFSTYMCILRHLVQINSKLAWECNQFVMKLADGMQLVWVAGCAGFDGNEIADHLARQGSTNLSAGPKPALGISAQVARVDQGLDK